MTNEELQAHLKALNDAATRGEIQFASFTNPGEWLAVETTFIDAKNYRIKPQPRDVWISTFDIAAKDGNMGGGCSANPAGWSHKRVFNAPTGDAVHYREVIE